MPAINISNELVRAINAVWDYIGSDCEQCANECGEELTNEMAIESCIDADRLKTNGHKAADKELHALIEQHGYGPVAKALEKKISLA